MRLCECVYFCFLIIIVYKQGILKRWDRYKVIVEWTREPAGFFFKNHSVHLYHVEIKEQETHHDWAFTHGRDSYLIVGRKQENVFIFRSWLEILMEQLTIIKRYKPSIWGETWSDNVYDRSPVILTYKTHDGRNANKLQIVNSVMLSQFHERKIFKFFLKTC